jgi:hypothetical protein
MKSGSALIWKRVACALAVCCIATSAKAQRPSTTLSDQRAEPKPGVLEYKTVQAGSPLPAHLPVLTRPEVLFQNGRLSISASNTGLDEILRDVHKLTGATIEAPANLRIRVTLSVGPGPASRILAELFERAYLNYVIAGALDDPTRVETIILTLRSAEPETVGRATATSAGTPPAQSETMTIAELTGGDEGVWDNVELPAIVPTPLKVTDVSSAQRPK